MDISDERLLVVDASSTNRRLITRLLESWECRCEEASAAETALEKLRAAAAEGDPFRVAIVDMVLPWGMNGETLGKKIKEDNEIRETVLIMTTAIGKRGEVARLEKAGFSAYLIKPVSPAHLHETLVTVIDRGSYAPIVTRHALADNRRRRLRVLIAEDSVTNQKVVMAIVAKLGIRADAVANGREAVKSLESIPYDLVLMDCQMPEMDGYEATRRIRDPRSAVLNHSIPIIALTAHAMLGEREKCLAAGMDDFVPKPVRSRRLVQIIENWLSVPSELSSLESSAAGGSPSNEVVFDKAGLFERVSGDESVIGEILDVFLDDAPSNIKALKEALDVGDAACVRLKAHVIKGAAGNVGAMALMETASRIELAGEEGDLRRATLLVPQVYARFEELRRVLAHSGLAGPADCPR